jgi:hypothetical protein
MWNAERGRWAIAVSLALGVHCVQALLHHPQQVLRLGRVMTVSVGRGDANSETAILVMLRAALVIPRRARNALRRA